MYEYMNVKKNMKFYDAYYLLLIIINNNLLFKFRKKLYIHIL